VTIQESWTAGLFGVTARPNGGFVSVIRATLYASHVTCGTFTGFGAGVGFGVGVGVGAGVGLGAGVGESVGEGSGPFETV
jgi:hypothetical protein